MTTDLKRRHLFITLALFFCFTESNAQVFELADKAAEPADHARTDVVVADGFWKHWFLQADLDMTLQHPYGYDFSKVFPNGYSFGMDIAFGKWFSHQVGVRSNFNWENRLPLLKNERANWLAPFNQPGVNREKGGYIALYGELLINLHNLFGTYRADRTWNLSAYPLVGVNYNFGVDKGSLNLGLGMLNTYRIDERWSLMADVAYVMTGSGFVGVNASGGTGTGTNSNGYFTFGLGAQYDFTTLEKLKDKGSYPGTHRVHTNGFWENWFVQAGLDIGLINPYGYDFSKVFPKGQTFGVNVALGKWFTPEFGVRGRFQWENGLIENKSLEWVTPVSDPEQNYKKGGFGVVSIETLINCTNIMTGCNPDIRWNTSVFVRAGIISQFVISSASPVMGIGIEETYRLNDRLSLYGSLGYQFTTSEGLSVTMTGLVAPTGTNGFADIDLGVVIDL